MVETTVEVFPQSAVSAFKEPEIVIKEEAVEALREPGGEYGPEEEPNPGRWRSET